jgi:hypothetical protein
MVSNRFHQSRFEIEEALVEGRSILAVQGDHFGPRLASADDLEGILLHSLNDSRCDGARRLTGEAQFRPRTRRTHHGRIGRSRIDRHDVHAPRPSVPGEAIRQT